MSKPKMAARNQLKRQGNFWQEGMPLTENDEILLDYLRNRASELGYTPLLSDVPEAGKIKGRFRCWKDAVRAAGLPSEREPEQVAKRMAARTRQTVKY
jgi:hypothetical protein